MRTASLRGGRARHRLRLHRRRLGRAHDAISDAHDPVHASAAARALRTDPSGRLRARHHRFAPELWRVGPECGHQRAPPGVAFSRNGMT